MRVLVTRPEPGAGELADALRAIGASAIVEPTVVIAPPERPAPLHDAVRAIGEDAYDWVVLTSANGVRALRDAPGRSWSAFPRSTRLAVVGTATAGAAVAAGWVPDLVPESFTAEDLTGALASRGVLTGLRVLFPAAAGARPTVPQELGALGATVHVVEAYRSVLPGPEARGRLVRLFEEEPPDLVTFTSPSTARHLGEIVGPAALAAPAAVIGPVTAEAVEALGYVVVAVASPHTAEGLVDAVAAWRDTRPKG